MFSYNKYLGFEIIDYKKFSDFFIFLFNIYLESKKAYDKNS